LGGKEGKMEGQRRVFETETSSLMEEGKQRHREREREREEKRKGEPDVGHLLYPIWVIRTVTLFSFFRAPIISSQFSVLAVFLNRASLGGRRPIDGVDDTAD